MAAAEAKGGGGREGGAVAAGRWRWGGGGGGVAVVVVVGWIGGVGGGEGWIERGTASLVQPGGTPAAAVQGEGRALLGR